ncbi:serine/threonine protein phosphatase PrpC/DNA-binding transcriptional MerR regulator [Streptomyces aurantiacus]|uniref:MerR family transcriptional regulator n=1 Tax=Streptomyces aurantiacus TaxID=47760 RepID=UPI00278CF03C|nr:MerR family transcriptional regulator [Streptomyces aurantiacus]MDQ0777447.1 serine/threonine protein phosphatase PrpC/DNA-binding transcriptional MerR regulator [Streptomyces aurantiacus]
MMTIGAFSKACRLSPKALRLYDELELLRPARVDPETGYRYYAPEQLEQARLVAWLRRLGMPLAEIREVRALEPADAAREIRAFWSRVEAETASRRDLASFLVDHLTRPRTGPCPSNPNDPNDPSNRNNRSNRSKETTMLELRCATLSDTGRVRPANQDTAYAGARVLAVADGFGSGGAPASGAAVEAFKFLDDEPLPAGSVLNLLEDAVHGATEAVREVAGPTDEVGTTLTAMVWTGSQLALVHIGDSRAYLLRDGGLFRITHDHTVVQSMLDEGRLTPEEATVHPQRALLLKALTGGGPASAPAPASVPDVRLHDARAGDRYLLCSDGLSAVVPEDTLKETLRTSSEPAEAVRTLVAGANASGGPDNVSCVVADVVSTAGPR